jgi:hypothetical protein
MLPAQLKQFTSKTKLSQGTRSSVGNPVFSEHLGSVMTGNGLSDRPIGADKKPPFELMRVKVTSPQDLQ